MPAISAPAVPRPTALPPAPPPAKEWLVSTPPLLHVEAAKHTPTPKEPETETVTTPASSQSTYEELPGRKRNLFHKARHVVARQIDRARAKAASTEDSDMLWFAVMVTGSLCMGLMIWGAYSALPRFGSVHAPLRAGVSTPTLKVTSDVSGRWTRELKPTHPQPHVPPLVPPVHVEPPPLHHPISVPTPPPIGSNKLSDVPHHTPPPMERPLDALPERNDPVIFVHANLGDTPMIRTWKKLAETSFLLAALSVPANNLLGQIPEKVAIDYSKQINDLTKAVQALSDQVAGIKLDEKLNAAKTELNDKISKIRIDKSDNSVDFQLLANRLDKMEKLIAQMITNPVAGVAPAPVQATANLDEIKSKLGNIEQAILKLQPADKRIALSPPSEPPLAKATTSHVIFVNLYTQDLMLFINNKQHRAPANSTLTLDNIPAGPATIEVRSPEGVFHRSSPTLVANETFTLTAR